MAGPAVTRPRRLRARGADPVARIDRAARPAPWLSAWALPLVVALGVTAPPALAQQTGTVGGRVLDRDSGEPVPGVLVEIVGATSTLTDARGVFILEGVPLGPLELRLQHLAYGTHTRDVTVEAGGELALDVSISTQAIELAPLVVETLDELALRRRTSGHSINEITVQDIDEASRAGLNLGQLLQTSMPGVMVRPGFGAQMCVTYRAIRTGNDRGDCDGVSVVLDGVPVADPSYIYSSIPLRDIERLEMLSPGQGGVRYGMRSGQSVLLIETKRGHATRRSDLSRLLTGLDWTGETEPYPWLSVFGRAFVANAIGVGIGLAMAERCFWTPDTSAFALRTRCAGVATAGASILSVALPAVGGSAAARWGGGTDRSHGRIVPSMVTAGMFLTGGYLLLIGGDGGTERAGIVVLGVGVPAAMTLSDRIFRILR